MVTCKDMCPVLQEHRGECNLSWGGVWGERGCRNKRWERTEGDVNRKQQCTLGPGNNRSPQLEWGWGT
jgi:hypothetical protein